MKNIAAVIGASFGDEGKGHIVDYLSGPGALVIRFNGGAQAGHTVVTPDGKRHVFHHFGSGTFTGASTFLSRHFLANPVLFVEEHRRLHHMGLDPKTYVDPQARVTTPWDMITNQTIERSRGDRRHGSCGIGIHETVVRHQRGVPLLVDDLLTHTTKKLTAHIHEIQTYGTYYLRSLGYAVPAVMHEQTIVNHFLDDVEYFLNYAALTPWGSPLLQDHTDFIFEGAQGLRLDSLAPGFPHVTCSRTGLTNVSELLREIEAFDPIELYYVTRPYLTRHGAGPLNLETDGPPYNGVVDETNVQNEFQGKLRFAWLDLDALVEPIRQDIEAAGRTGLFLEPSLALTCADHVDAVARWYESGELRTGKFEEFLKALRDRVRELPMFGHANALVSNGPTRDHFARYST